MNLLGGPSRETVDCYASPIPYMARPEDSADKAREFVAEGFRAVKLKIGRGISTDLAHVEAARAAMGTDVKLLVDANGAYTVSESVALAKDLVRLGVYWLEEPVHPEYPDDLARIRRRVDLPVVSGEWLGTWYQFRDLLKAEAVDVIMPNITRCGGITGMMKIADHGDCWRMLRSRRTGWARALASSPRSPPAPSCPTFLIYEYNQLFNPLRHSVMREAIQLPRTGNPGGPAKGIGLGGNARRIRHRALSSGLACVRRYGIRGGSARGFCQATSWEAAPMTGCKRVLGYNNPLRARNTYVIF